MIEKYIAKIKAREKENRKLKKLTNIKTNKDVTKKQSTQ